MSKTLKRYSDSDRMNHWFIAIMFFLSALSGLAFFHPSLYFLNNLFGGGTWTRILHPFLGVLMFLGFIIMFFRVVKDNIFKRADREWRKQSGRSEERRVGKESTSPRPGCPYRIRQPSSTRARRRRHQCASSRQRTSTRDATKTPSA